MPIPVIIHKQPLTRKQKTGLRFQLKNFDQSRYRVLAMPVVDKTLVSMIGRAIEISKIKYRYFRIEKYFCNGKIHWVLVEKDKEEI